MIITPVIDLIKKILNQMHKLILIVLACSSESLMPGGCSYLLTFSAANRQRAQSFMVLPEQDAQENVMLYNPWTTQGLGKYYMYVTSTKVALGTFMMEKGPSASNRRCLLHLTQAVLT